MTKTRKKSATKANIDLMSAEISRLHTKRSAWENGAYKRSNELLYELLAECHTLLVQLRGEIKLRKKLNSAIEAAGFKVRSNTSLELKVVRAVFGVENNRSQAYVRVLQLAKKEMPKGWTLPEWIEEQGGVEEVRRKPKEGPSAADKAKQFRELAEEKLANAAHIGKRFLPHDSLQPDDSGDYNYSIALVRTDADGKASLVFGTNKNALVKAVLTEAGQQLAQRNSDEHEQSKHTKKLKARDEVLAAEDVTDAIAA